MGSQVLRAVLLVAFLFGLTSGAACRSEPSYPAAETATAPSPDGGLPPPPPSSRHGVIVPSDMGMGTGPAGPGGVAGPAGGAPSPAPSPPGMSH